MKKTAIFPLLLISLYLGLSGCEAPERESGEKIDSKTIVPVSSDEDLSQSQFRENIPEEYFEENVTPRVGDFPDEMVLQVMNVNLDFDRVDEQITVLKDRKKTKSPIEIAVIDYNNVTNSYEVSWKNKTSAVNIRNFNIAFEDIVGDHNLEIICFGIDEKGNRTLDVFRKTHSPTGVGLYYKSIIHIDSDGTIEIDRKERSQAYKQGQKNGISFPIVSFSQDPESDNMFDLIVREYYWKYQESRYVLGKEEKIPGKKIEEKQLHDLFQQEVDAYEHYLDGLWYKTLEGDTDDIFNEHYEMIHFNQFQRSISFYEKGLQEVYKWEDSHKTRIPNSFYLNAQNELVPFIRKQISIQVLTIDSIKIFVQDNDFKKSDFKWDGTYVKLSDNVVATLTKSSLTGPVVAPEQLTGTFLSNSGIEISFNFPRFSYQNKDEKKQGGYSVYPIEDTNVLELKAIKRNGLVEDTIIYSIEYEKEVQQNSITHTVILEPGEVTVHGFTSSGEQPLRFERIEFIEDDKRLN